KVVLNLVGPYTRFGRPVIEACVEGGSHYADLTGEMPFVRRIIDALHNQAERAGVKVVNTAGFESLPADLAVALAVRTAEQRWQEPLRSVDMDVTFKPPPGLPRWSDMLSGGTLQSTLAIASDERADETTDPAA